jgi:Flp pilus assembly protein CpaB
MRLKYLSKFEPVYVLSINKNLQVGDVIGKNDLRATLVYKQEFSKLNYTEPGTGLKLPSLIALDYDESSGKILKGHEDVLGRVVKLPVFAGSLLRQEYLAPQGTLPGLINLIDKKHSLVNVEVPQLGFNVFIKPDDRVDIFELYAGGSRLIATKVKVIMVDAMALGEAPMQVEADPKKLRHLTLAIPDENFTDVLRAQKSKTLFLTYKNKVADEVKLIQSARVPTKNIAKQVGKFQALTMIQGDHKEHVTR